MSSREAFSSEVTKKAISLNEVASNSYGKSDASNWIVMLPTKFSKSNLNPFLYFQ